MPISMPTKFMAVSVILSKLNKCSEKGGLVPPFFISLQGISFPLLLSSLRYFLFLFSPRFLPLSFRPLIPRLFSLPCPFCSGLSFSCFPVPFFRPCLFSAIFLFRSRSPSAACPFFPLFCWRFPFLIFWFCFLHRVGYFLLLLLSCNKSNQKY